MGGDVSGAARDSLSFAAARGAYLDGDASSAEKLASYLRNYPSGANTDDALFYLSDCYVKSGERARAVETMSRLADRGRSQYSQRVLGVLAPMAYEGRACTTVRRSRIWRCTRCCRRAIRAVRLCRDMRVR